MIQWRLPKSSPASGATYAARAIESAMDALLHHGHRRIVILAATAFRNQNPSRPSKNSHRDSGSTRIYRTGLSSSPFRRHHRRAGKLPRLIVQDHTTYGGIAQQSTYCAALIFFLARRGLQVPRDVSVICGQIEPTFRMTQPSLAHFTTPVKAHIASMIRWVSTVANGRPAHRQVKVDAIYVPGGTVGPVKR